MANAKWIGGASSSSQVFDYTPANVGIGNIFTLTATAEDGTTTLAVNFTATDATVANVTAGIVSAWNQSTNGLATPVTAVDNTTKVTLSADTAGIPFSIASSATGGTATFVAASVTANSGPEDWNTVSNWEAAAVPSSSDDVRITGRYNIRYGLDQSAVALTSLYIGDEYRGSIGDESSGYFLAIDATTININTGGAFVYINGTSTDVTVKRTTSGSDRVRLDGDIGTLTVTGRTVRGEVKVEASAVLDNVYVLDAPASRVTTLASISSFDLIEMDSGTFDNSSNIATVNISGGEYVQTDGAISSKLNIRKASLVNYNSDGTLAEVEILGGTLSFTDSTADSVTITTTTMRSGSLLLASGLVNQTFTNAIVNTGGRVVPESGKTVQFA